MISWYDLNLVANSNRVSPFVILREYIQILFLNHFYSLSLPAPVVFKGGTCLRLLHNSNRYSEDLDFTTDLDSQEIDQLVSQTVQLIIEQTPPIHIKTEQTIAGFTQKLSLKIPESHTPLSIKLDFSQREQILLTEQRPISSLLPIASFSPITFMNTQEILAEKLRALLSRHKGRDIYDLWFLFRRKTPINSELIQKKLDYHAEEYNPEKIISAVKKWSIKDFDQDVRGFLPERDRNIIPQIIPNLLQDLTTLV